MKRADWLFVILVFCSPILVNTILGLKLGVSNLSLVQKLLISKRWFSTVYLSQLTLLYP